MFQCRGKYTCHTTARLRSRYRGFPSYGSLTNVCKLPLSRLRDTTVCTICYGVCISSKLCLHVQYENGLGLSHTRLTLRIYSISFALLAQPSTRTKTKRVAANNNQSHVSSTVIQSSPASPSPTPSDCVQFTFRASSKSGTKN